MLEANEAVMNRLKAAGIPGQDGRSDQSAGWKFAEYEMKGIPLFCEVGPRDIAEGQCVLVRRDTREKTVVKFEDLEKTIPALLEDIQKSLYEKALANREAHTYTAKSLDEMKSILLSTPALSSLCGAATRLRGEGQGRDRYAEPLHAVRAGAHRRYLSGLRQACKQDGCLGHRVLSEVSEPKNCTSKSPSSVDEGLFAPIEKLFQQIERFVRQ